MAAGECDRVVILLENGVAEGPGERPGPPDSAECDKSDDWKAGVAALEQALAACERSATANEEKAMLDGVDAVQRRGSRECARGTLLDHRGTARASADAGSEYRVSASEAAFE
ncbi:MAG: hypothetical protein ACYC7A_14950 [Thermoanaerobaculia bacterium]